MKDLINDLLNIGITVGLSDREGFVKNVSDLLQKYHDDPKRTEKLARAITDYLEQVKDNINNRNSIKSAISGAEFGDKQSINELTRAIQELTNEMRRSK
jgi:hypothetical protein